MDNIKNIVTGGIITLVIGGGAYTFSQEALVQNFAEDTGMTQEEATEYVNNISEDEFASWDEIGNDFAVDSEETYKILDEIDCDAYEYSWESTTLSCTEAKIQLGEIASTEQKLGIAYKKLDTESASLDDMKIVIGYLDELNLYYKQEVASALFDSTYVDEMFKTNAYNKSVLTSAIESQE